jgi:hypothetical protein
MKKIIQSQAEIFIHSSRNAIAPFCLHYIKEDQSSSLLPPEVAVRDEVPKGRTLVCIHYTSLQEFATVVAQGCFVAVLASVAVEAGIVVGGEEPIGFVQRADIAAEVEPVVAVEADIAAEEPVVVEEGPPVAEGELAAAEEEFVGAEVVVYIGPGAFGIGEEFAGGIQVA